MWAHVRYVSVSTPPGTRISGEISANHPFASGNIPLAAHLSTTLYGTLLRPTVPAPGICVFQSTRAGVRGTESYPAKQRGQPQRPKAANARATGVWQGSQRVRITFKCGGACLARARQNKALRKECLPPQLLRTQKKNTGKARALQLPRACVHHPDRATPLVST